MSPVRLLIPLRSNDPDMDDRAVGERLKAERQDAVERLAAMSADLATLAAAAAGSNLDDEHDPEGATVAFEREQLAARRAQTERHLTELDAALERLRTGRYGRCEGCGEPIAAARLEVLPATRLCVRCAANHHRPGRG